MNGFAAESIRANLVACSNSRVFKNEGEFYRQLLTDVTKELGPVDPKTLTAIIGFDAGGPLNLFSIGRGLGEFVTYITCELATRVDQVRSEVGPYELMVTCDNEPWAREILTQVGRMTTETQFGHGHTLDISLWVDSDASIQGLTFELHSSRRIGFRKYGVFRLHGLTRDELLMAEKSGIDVVLQQRRAGSLYPRTAVGTW